MKRGYDASVEEPEEETGTTGRGEEHPVNSSMWTVVQKNRGMARRRQGIGFGDVGKQQNINWGSRFAAVHEEIRGTQLDEFGQPVTEDKADHTKSMESNLKATRDTPLKQGGKFNYKHQETKNRFTRRNTKESSIRKEKTSSDKNILKKHAEGKGKESTTIQQRKETVSSNAVRYKDVVEIDEDGKVLIKSYEVPSGSVQELGHMQENILFTGQEIRLNHAPRPLEFGGY